MRQDQERIKNLLIDTVTLLCKNSVQFQEELHLEGLLGVSVDKKDVFFVHISKEFSNSPSSGATVTQSVADSQEGESHVETSAETDSPQGFQQDRRDSVRDVPETDQRTIKTESAEADDECLIVEQPQIKLEQKGSPAQMIAGQRRAVKRTSNVDSQQYSSDSNISGGYGMTSGNGDSYDNSQYGEPSIKRRAEDPANDGYLPGDSEDPGGTPWPSLAGSAGFDPSQAFQQDSDNSQMSAVMDSSQPGCSSWSTAGRGVSESVHNYFKFTAPGRTLPQDPQAQPYSATGPASAMPNPTGGCPRQKASRWECQTCGLLCTSESLLERHKMIHTGERPFVCDTCGKTFNRKYHLDRHVNTIHRPSDQTFSTILKELAYSAQP